MKRFTLDFSNYSPKWLGHASGALTCLVLLSCLSTTQAAPDQRLWPEEVLRALLSQASGQRAYQDTARISTYSRYPASKGFHQSAEYVAERARQVGLVGVRIQAVPANRPSWDVTAGDLWLVEPERRKLADIVDIPVSVAMFSRNADLTAEVVDVGTGTKDSDYEGKDVRGKIVLASGPPERVQQQAIVSRQAAGIISYFSNEFFGIRPSKQSVSWTRLSSSGLQGKDGGFAFMISPAAGEELRQRAGRGERFVARAHIRVDSTSPGRFEMVTGEIPGEEVEGQDVVFTAHLDHQNPGANDNASGSATLLEIARLLSQLKAAGTLRPQRRTIRFWWVTEIQGTFQYFLQHPEEARTVLADINIDQAGGNRDGRSDFVAILQPPWMATYIDDIIQHLGRYAMDHLADVYHAPSPSFVSPTGTSQPFIMRFWPYRPLSDHVVFEMAGIDIPSISLAAASLEFIHTNEDSIAHIDPTQLKRSAFLGAASGWLLASLGPDDLPRLLALVQQGGHERVGRAEGRALARLATSTKETIHREYKLAYYTLVQAFEHQSRVLASLTRFHNPTNQDETAALLAYEARFAWNLLAQQEAAVGLLADQYSYLCRQRGVTPEPLEPTEEERRLSRLVPRRIIKLGPAFVTWRSYSWQPLGADLSRLIKNFIDGKRSVAEIQRAVISSGKFVELPTLEAFVHQLASRGWVEISSK